MTPAKLRAAASGCETPRDDEERQLGRDGERGRAWKKREQRTAERQEDRIRYADAACPGRQDHGRDEQNKELFKLLMAPIVTIAGPCRCGSST